MSNVIPNHTTMRNMGWNYFKAKNSHKFWPLNPKVCEDEEDIKDRLIIVTGCNVGLGKETVLHLATRGAHIIMACRDLDKANQAMEEIKLKVPDAKLETMQLDLGDLKSIRDFVKEFQSKYHKLDILINNAGYYNTTRVRETNKSGFETHIGINHLGPFLLTRLLIDSLKKAVPSRIICVSSGLMAVQSLDLDDLMIEKLDLVNAPTNGNGREPYGRSKLANFLCMKKLAEELDGSGVKIFQVHPGLVNTDISRYEQGFFNKLFHTIAGSLMALNVTQGCETTIFCAVSKSIAEKGGKGEMVEFCEILDYGDSFISTSDEKVKKLYEMSEKLVGL